MTIFNNSYSEDWNYLSTNKEKKEAKENAKQIYLKQNLSKTIYFSSPIHLYENKPKHCFLRENLSSI